MVARRLLPSLLALGLATACDDDPSPTPAAVARPPDRPSPDSHETGAGPTATPWVGVVRPQLEIEVAAPISGRVSDVLVSVGDAVDLGTPLLVFDDAPLADEVARLEAMRQAARADEALAIANRRATSLELQRSRSLASRGAIAGAELDAARLAAEQARARVEAARAGVRQAETERAMKSRIRTEATLRAPWPAQVAARHVDPGASVAAGAPLVRLVSRDLAVAFAMPASAADRIPDGGLARVEIDGGAVIEASPVLLDPEVDPASGMRFARVAWPPGAPALPPGTVVIVRMEAAS